MFPFIIASGPCAWAFGHPRFTPFRYVIALSKPLPKRHCDAKSIHINFCMWSATYSGRLDKRGLGGDCRRMPEDGKLKSLSSRTKGRVVKQFRRLKKRNSEAIPFPHREKLRSDQPTSCQRTSSCHRMPLLGSSMLNLNGKKNPARGSRLKRLLEGWHPYERQRLPTTVKSDTG